MLQKMCFLWGGAAAVITVAITVTLCLVLPGKQVITNLTSSFKVKNNLLVHFQLIELSIFSTYKIKNHFFKKTLINILYVFSFASNN